MRALAEKYATVFPWPRHLSLLSDDDVGPAFDFINPDYVFNLAGYNGGIGFNKLNPGKIFIENTLMGLNLISNCIRHRVQKIVSVVASCSYSPVQFVGDACSDIGAHYILERHDLLEEESFLELTPHESVACHGYAKRNLQLASYFANKQYGLNAVCACPTTLFGSEDSFDPERTKVLGALVKKFVDAADAKADEVVLWGSGKPLREFLYVEDAAKLLLRVMECYDDSSMPLNLGSGQELSIKELAELIAKQVGFNGKISWDTSKPDGQYRKRLDLTRMEAILGKFYFTPLETGVLAAIESYRSQKCQ